MCFVFRVCLKQKLWLILREQNEMWFCTNRAETTKPESSSVGYQPLCMCLCEFVFTLKWKFTKRWQSKLLQCLMWSAAVVYEKVRCQCRNKEPTVKVQQVEQVRIVSEFVLGFFAVCETWTKDTWVSTQRIRLCFCVFLLGNVPLFVSLWKQSAPCAVRMSFGDFSHFEFLLSGRWRILSFLEVFVCWGRFHLNTEYISKMCALVMTLHNMRTLRTRQLGHKVMNSQDCWQVCSRGVSRVVKKGRRGGHWGNC